MGGFCWGGGGGGGSGGGSDRAGKWMHEIRRERESVCVCMCVCVCVCAFVHACMCVRVRVCESVCEKRETAASREIVKSGPWVKNTKDI